MMDRKVLIVYNSAIVREGLSSIIQKFTVGENIRMEVTAKMDDNLIESPCSLLVFCDIASAEILRHHTSTGLKIHRKIIGVVDVNTKPGYTAHFDEFISIDAPLQNIRKIVARFFDLAGMDTSKKEGIEITSREREVLELVSTGFSNKEIADALFISTHTVISHRKNITEKLGIKSISGLTIYAMLNKIIDADKMDLQSLI